MKITKNDAVKVLNIVDKGLVCGVGVPKAGKLCVEAAVCLAMGYEHSDTPECVGEAPCQIKIAINDAVGWSSSKARARGLRRAAVAQLGSDRIYSDKFNNEFTAAVYKELILPIILEDEETSAVFKAKAKKAKTAEQICGLLREWDNKGLGVVYDFFNYTRFDGFEDVIGSLVDYYGSGDKTLTRIAECVVTALKKCKSPGCKFLDLCPVGGK